MFSKKPFCLRPQALLIALFMSVLIETVCVFPIWGATPTGLAFDQNVKIFETIIQIRHRAFQPQELILSAGKKTRLILKNLDTELHAFLPVGLVADTHVAVSGNGAPQFSKEGFIRVLLPTRGQTEIVFTPTHPGTYPYLCDLPGHVMRGTIVVRENTDVIQ